LQRFVARYGFLVLADNESPAQRYRRLAEECLDVAYTFPEGERRTVLVQMAQVWQRLADERVGSAATPLFSRAGGQAAPMQQQQQQQQKIHPDEDKRK
jgi:hypothetical protein